MKRVTLAAVCAVCLLAGTASAKDDEGSIAKGKTAPGTFALVDAANKRIGVFYPSSMAIGMPIVLANLDGATVALSLFALQSGDSLDTERLVFWRQQLVWYPTANCTGIPLIRGNTATWGTRPIVMTFDGTDVKAHIGASGFTTSQAYQSFFDGRSCSAQSGQIEASRLERSVNLTSKFREPLRVVME